MPGPNRSSRTGSFAGFNLCGKPLQPIAAGLPLQPRIYVVEDHRPNAFAVGRKPEKTAVAVTSGLIRLLNRDELQGVVAHQIAHVKNLDIRFMAIAAVLAGTVEMSFTGTRSNVPVAKG